MSPAPPRRARGTTWRGSTVPGSSVNCVRSSHALASRSLHFAGAIAGLLERALREQASSASTPARASDCTIAVGGAPAAHHHVRLGVDVHEVRVGIEIAVLGGVAVQAGADGDHAVGFFAQLHRRARRIGAGDAEVIFVLGQPGLGHQRGAISAPMRSASFRTASPAPDHMAPRPTRITRLLGCRR